MQELHPGREFLGGNIGVQLQRLRGIGRIGGLYMEVDVKKISEKCRTNLSDHMGKIR